VIASQLRTALRAAMRARDTVAVSALRSAVAALDNATAVPAPRDPGPGSGHAAGPASGHAAGPGSGHAAGPGSGHVAGGVSGLGAGEAPRRALTPAEEEAIVRAEIADRLAAADIYGPGPAASRLRAEADLLAAVLADQS
jgi:uncharacterized protein